MQGEQQEKDMLSSDGKKPSFFSHFKFFFLAIAIITILSGATGFITLYSQQSRAMLIDDEGGGGNTNSPEPTDRPDNSIGADPEVEEQKAANVLDTILAEPTDEPEQDTQDQDAKNTSLAPTTTQSSGNPCDGGLYAFASKECEDYRKKTAHSDPMYDINPNLNDAQVKKQLEAQIQMQKQQDLITLSTNMMKIMHEMSMSVIRNLP